MEHNRSDIIPDKYGLQLSEGQKLLLSCFADAVFRSGEKFNLTGHKTMEAIMSDLVINSILPLKNITVPRGTEALDMGTGAGVPGIPLAVIRPDIRWTLMDSSIKKTEFINRFIQENGLGNVQAVNGRIEELALLPEYRFRYGLIVTRAMASPYICAELGTSFMKKKGMMYLYTRLKEEDLSKETGKHLGKCGLMPAGSEEKNAAGTETGILLIKKKDSPSDYPRRYSVIKREAAKAEAIRAQKPF